MKSLFALGSLLDTDIFQTGFVRVSALVCVDGRCGVFPAARVFASSGKKKSRRTKSPLFRPGLVDASAPDIGGGWASASRLCHEGERACVVGRDENGECDYEHAIGARERDAASVAVGVQ